MYFKQLLHEGSGCISYLVGCMSTPVLAVVDPQGDPAAYLREAERRGQRITHVVETHIHADHLSCGRQLARLAGAALCLHEAADVCYPFQGLRDGQTLDIGNAHLTVLHTPGHTPESMCLLVEDHARSKAPYFVLTGDTLLVGDVGRPDFPGASDAAQLYDSLAHRLLALDDHVEVYPAHFAGSVCGRGLSPKPSSTIGYERRWNTALQRRSRADFLAYIHADLPPKPHGFEETIQRNKGALP